MKGSDVRKFSLDAIAREQLEAAARADSARASTTVVGGHEHVMRQTVIALTAGAVLAEHENPGEASIYVIVGRVDLQVGKDSWQARTGDLVEIPPARHSLRAIEDSAVLLTAVPRGNFT
jgi:quercetin dioxygenase-like cupin family protein